MSLTHQYGGFRTPIAQNVFHSKYALGEYDTWAALSKRVVTDVCGNNGVDFKEALVPQDELDEMEKDVVHLRMIPGGRYLYYAGRPLHFFNNCFLLKAEEDTREEWGNVLKRASDCLMSGGGIGIDYSILRPKGQILKRTGGASSGPLPLMRSVNEVGRNVMQGGSRRSAIWAGLNWQHGDAHDFVKAKNWSQAVRDLKAEDFNFPANLDMTNISLLWDDQFLRLRDEGHLPQIWYDHVRQARKTGEPGSSFNFGAKSQDTLRNACCEVTSADDSDVCNLLSINMGAIETLEEFKAIVARAAKFLVCGTIRADLPYEKVHQVRAKNRRLGMGLMGMHEWLLKRGYGYEVVPEMHQWLEVYRDVSKSAADAFCDELGISRPVAYRAIAPTGTIGILASTTTGIEPMYAIAYKRRYLTNGTEWKFEYVIDATAQTIIDATGCDPDKIETTYTLAMDPERRIKFQADVQDYVDMSISSTLNLPSWGSEHNNDGNYREFAEMLAKYAHRLRGFTCYPDGARGGQPLTAVSYSEARGKTGVVYDEYEEKCASGLCGI